MKSICAKCKRELLVAHYDEIVQEGPAKVFFYPCMCVAEEINGRIRDIMNSIKSPAVIASDG